MTFWPYLWVSQYHHWTCKQMFEHILTNYGILPLLCECKPHKTRSSNFPKIWGQKSLLSTLTLFIKNRTCKSIVWIHLLHKPLVTILKVVFVELFQICYPSEDNLWKVIKFAHFFHFLNDIVSSGLSLLSKHFQLYHDGVWLRQRAQYSRL